MPGFGTLRTTKVGKLRHRARLDRKVVSATDSRGHDTYTWVNAGSIACEIRNLSGNEAETARQLVPTATHRITARYNSEITAERRLVFNSRQFYIGYVDNLGELNRFMMILATEDMG